MSHAEIPPELAGTFEARREGDRRAVVRRDFAGEFDALRLIAVRGAETVSGSELPGGRGEARVLAAEGGDVVVRPGRRGGWLGRLVERRYFLGDRFVDELILTERLRRRGAPVPVPLAAVRRERALGYETWFVSRRIHGVVPAALALSGRDPEERRRALRQIGRTVRALHDAGGEHADLNAWNLLVERDARCGHVVDLDRGRLWPDGVPPRRAARNLARLERSLRRLELAGALRDWGALEAGYASIPVSTGRDGAVS